MLSWNIVITGTSRGIGLELVKVALERGHQVLAVARSPEKSTELVELQKKAGDRLQTFAQDVSVPEAATHIRTRVSEKWDHVDLLINNAGILRKGDSPQDLLQSFQVNSMAPFLITRELLPLLKKSASPKVLQITSQMGSIADNSSGGYYAYRSSKAALNMMTKSLSIDQPWLSCLVAHPGWVQTDMGGRSAPTLPKESAQGLWKLVEGMSSKNSGSFFTEKGRELPW